MSKTAVVWSCSHSDPDVSNERFNWLGELIYDIRPDYVVDLGDGADEAWAGQSNSHWAKGVVIKRNIEDGVYDFQWISMEALEKEYGTP